MPVTAGLLIPHDTVLDRRTSHPDEYLSITTENAVAQPQSVSLVASQH
jgi:hypothetical protein